MPTSPSVSDSFTAMEISDNAMEISDNAITRAYAFTKSRPWEVFHRMQILKALPLVSGCFKGTSSCVNWLETLAKQPSSSSLHELERSRMVEMVEVCQLDTEIVH